MGKWQQLIKCQLILIFLYWKSDYLYYKIIKILITTPKFFIVFYSRSLIHHIIILLKIIKKIKLTNDNLIIYSYKYQPYHSIETEVLVVVDLWLSSLIPDCLNIRGPSPVTIWMHLGNTVSSITNGFIDASLTSLDRLSELDWRRSLMIVAKESVEKLC